MHRFLLVVVIGSLILNGVLLGRRLSRRTAPAEQAAALRPPQVGSVPGPRPSAPPAFSVLPEGAARCDEQVKAHTRTVTAIRDQLVSKVNPRKLFEAGGERQPSYEALIRPLVARALSNDAGADYDYDVECRDLGCQVSVFVPDAGDRLDWYLRLQKTKELRVRTGGSFGARRTEPLENALTKERVLKVKLYFGAPVFEYHPN